MNDSRKLKEHFECPIDNIYINISDIISPYFKKLNFTPNDITTLSLIFGLLSCSYLIKESYILAGIFYILSYYFDCMDGNYARRYKMVSKNGDKYDHYKDISIGIFLFLILFYKKLYFGMFIYILTFIFTIFMLGCQEHLYSKNESETLNITKILSVCSSKEDSLKILPYLRYCGLGTMHTIFGLYLIYIGYIFSTKK